MRGLHAARQRERGSPLLLERDATAVAVREAFHHHHRPLLCLRLRRARPAARPLAVAVRERAELVPSASFSLARRGPHLPGLLALAGVRELHRAAHRGRACSRARRGRAC